MTALRFAGRILLSPVLLALKLLLLFSTFLAAVSMGLLSIVSSLLGIIAVLVMFTVSMESGVALMVLAWLISPIGLPLLAEKLLYFLSDLDKAGQAQRKRTRENAPAFALLLALANKNHRLSRWRRNL